MARDPVLPARPVGRPGTRARRQAPEESPADRPQGAVRVPPARARASGPPLTPDASSPDLVQDRTPWRRAAWLPGTFAVCRLPADTRVETPKTGRVLYSVTRTDSELSIVCDERDAPTGARCETGWRAFRLHGPIPFETTGVIASLSAALAGAGVGLFVVSTFDTDIVLVKTPDAPRAEEALGRAGWELEERR